jgi:hypothetical protein
MQIMAEPCHITVQSELDIVTLRHTVRQFARAIGLDLPRQAKVTVAISAVARAFMGNQNGVMFTVQVSHQMPHPALEIACHTPLAFPTNSMEYVEDALNIQEVRLLVDEFHVGQKDDTITLQMRMWINL